MAIHEIHGAVGLSRPRECRDSFDHISEFLFSSLALVQGFVQIVRQRIECGDDPLQLVSTAVHVAHSPALHSFPLGHALPQLPQLAGSDVTSTQVPEQLDCPVGHWHAPTKHCFPPAHAAPQLPQFAGSALVSVQPLLQSVRPEEQAEAQTPDEHTSLPLHAVPQATQLAGSFDVSTHDPEHATVGDLSCMVPSPGIT